MPAPARVPTPAPEPPVAPGPEPPRQLAQTPTGRGVLPIRTTATDPRKEPRERSAVPRLAGPRPAESRPAESRPAESRPAAPRRTHVPRWTCGVRAGRAEHRNLRTSDRPPEAECARTSTRATTGERWHRGAR